MKQQHTKLLFLGNGYLHIVYVQCQPHIKKP